MIAGSNFSRKAIQPILPTGQRQVKTKPKGGDMTKRASRAANHDETYEKELFG
jgi:hypothetical protein